jgi:hypothetical protein
VSKAKSLEEWVVGNLFFLIVKNVVAVVFVIGTWVGIEEAATSLSLVIVSRRQRVALWNQRHGVSAAFGLWTPFLHRTNFHS